MNYLSITKDDMLNGDGLRTVLWVSGCSIHCPDCQNKYSWDQNEGIEFDDKARDELYENLTKPYISGLTISGGHPLEIYNYRELLDLCSDIKKYYPEKTIWLYTGFVWEDIKLWAIMDYIDVLVDGPFIKELQDNKLHWVGSSNQRVIDVQESLKRKEIVLYGGK